MDKKVMNNLFNIACMGLTLAGIIFLCVKIFGDGSENCLYGSLLCISLSNMFASIRSFVNKE